MKVGPTMDAAVAEKVMLYAPRAAGSFRPSELIEDAYAMESFIARRGLKAVYAHELFRYVVLRNRVLPTSDSMFWLFAHATPEQRCRAALACAGAK